MQEIHSRLFTCKRVNVNYNYVLSIVFTFKFTVCDIPHSCTNHHMFVSNISIYISTKWLTNDSRLNFRPHLWHSSNWTGTYSSSSSSTKRKTFLLGCGHTGFKIKTSMKSMKIIIRLGKSFNNRKKPFFQLVYFTKKYCF